jgi:hypothetical protein
MLYLCLLSALQNHVVQNLDIVKHSHEGTQYTAKDGEKKHVLLRQLAKTRYQRSSNRQNYRYSSRLQRRLLYRIATYDTADEYYTPAEPYRR